MNIDRLGHFLPHPSIQFTGLELYRGGRVHLSEKGIDIFPTDIQQGLRKALASRWGL